MPDPTAPQPQHTGDTATRAEPTDPPLYRNLTRRTPPPTPVEPRRVLAAMHAVGWPDDRTTDDAGNTYYRYAENAVAAADAQQRADLADILRPVIKLGDDEPLTDAIQRLVNRYRASDEARVRAEQAARDAAADLSSERHRIAGLLHDTNLVDAIASLIHTTVAGTTTARHLAAQLLTQIADAILIQPRPDRPAPPGLLPLPIQLVDTLQGEAMRVGAVQDAHAALPQLATLLGNVGTAVAYPGHAGQLSRTLVRMAAVAMLCAHAEDQTHRASLETRTTATSLQDALRRIVDEYPAQFLGPPDRHTYPITPELVAGSTHDQFLERHRRLVGNFASQAQDDGSARTAAPDAGAAPMPPANTTPASPPVTRPHLAVAQPFEPPAAGRPSPATDPRPTSATPTRSHDDQTTTGHRPASPPTGGHT